MLYRNSVFMVLTGDGKKCSQILEQIAASIIIAQDNRCGRQLIVFQLECNRASVRRQELENYKMADNKEQLQDPDNDMTDAPREKHAHNNRQSRPANNAHPCDELGANSEIGTKLRALYSSIQDETIPERFLDLLEKLDQVERLSSTASRN